ncbi:hypothetical protein [Paraconexibacter sp.]|uniref:hypothetical protein n=1 Tax=Paraconexibacter sp. TaxID=2949640 RepID=UPI003562B019
MRRLVLALALPALVALTAATQAQAAESLTRYSLVNGCFSLSTTQGPVAAGEKVRMQATALGRYLLFLPDGTYLTGQGDDRAPAPEKDPSPQGEWRVEEEGSGPTFSLTALEGGAALKGVTFTPADGCAAYPEAELNATGAPARSSTEFGEVRGILEGHMHWMTYEKYGRQFQCGRPWHRYGIAKALPDCSGVEGPKGIAAPMQNFFNYGNPVAPHDTSGYPKLASWGNDNLTYEGTYWRWVQRAHMAGLRLMVMGVNDNRVLCEVQARKETNCNEMDTVRRGLRAIRELEDYVDAQSGGPGKGFFEVVTDPFEARRVINEGRMAVVLEIEVSEPFDCRGWDNPTCDRGQIDRQLDELHDLGVRSLLLLNKFDNPLTGVRFDSGLTGLLTNPGNRLSAGTFFSARTCTGPFRDNTIETFVPPASSALDTVLTSFGVQPGTAPVYPPAPHCNTRGLTDLGKYTVGRMMDRGMIVNPDHMSQASVEDTLSLLEARRYSGVISPHGWVDPGNWPRFWKLGGLAFPGHSDAKDYVKEYERYRPKSTPFFTGWGYGADLGGMAQQPQARNGSGEISYPFKSYDGRVTFERQVTGERTFDYTKEGVAHYGLYAEWFEDLRRLGGAKLAEDMSRGAEAYLQMWERTEGVRPGACAPSRRKVTTRGIGGLRLGDHWETVLRRAGQPQQRGRAWSWCVRGRGNAKRADVAVLNDAGRVELVGSTATGRPLGTARVGRRARGRTVVRVRGQRVTVVRAGKVQAVALATRRLARDPKRLRTAVRRLLAAKASAAVPTYEPSPAEEERAKTGAAPTGRTLAGTANPRLDRAIELLCRLQL